MYSFSNAGTSFTYAFLYGELNNSTLLFHLIRRTVTHTMNNDTMGMSAIRYPVKMPSSHDEMNLLYDMGVICSLPVSPEPRIIAGSAAHIRAVVPKAYR
jgi:hypothetical protein